MTGVGKEEIVLEKVRLVVSLSLGIRNGSFTFSHV